MNTKKEIQTTISNSFDNIILECRSVLASELHYQAMVYSILRNSGVPIDQIGMNVKTTIMNPTSDFLKKRILKKDVKFQSNGIEIIPDILFFDKGIKADWRRRNYLNTLEHSIYSLEIKASERSNSRLSYNEIKTDILKLKAQSDETYSKYKKRIGIGILIIDVAPDFNERIKDGTLDKIIKLGIQNFVDVWYISQDKKREILS